jgi:hypothetical protein
MAQTEVVACALARVPDVAQPEAAAQALARCARRVPDGSRYLVPQTAFCADQFGFVVTDAGEFPAEISTPKSRHNN